jgi:hypothetical protein
MRVPIQRQLPLLSPAINPLFDRHWAHTHFIRRVNQGVQPSLLCSLLGRDLLLLLGHLLKTVQDRTMHAPTRVGLEADAERGIKAIERFHHAEEGQLQVFVEFNFVVQTTPVIGGCDSSGMGKIETHQMLACRGVASLQPRPQLRLFASLSRRSRIASTDVILHRRRNSQPQ